MIIHEEVQQNHGLETQMEDVYVNVDKSTSNVTQQPTQNNDDATQIETTSRFVLPETEVSDIQDHHQGASIPSRETQCFLGEGEDQQVSGTSVHAPQNTSQLAEAITNQCSVLPSKSKCII